MDRNVIIHVRKDLYILHFIDDVDYDWFLFVKHGDMHQWPMGIGAGESAAPNQRNSTTFTRQEDRLVIIGKGSANPTTFPTMLFHR